MNSENKITDQKQSTLDNSIMSVLGKPINIHTASYLRQDEGTDSIFDDLTNDDYDSLTVAGKEFKFPKEFLPDGSDVQFNNSTTKREASTVEESGSNFYSFGESLESKFSAETNVLMFSTEIDLEFNLDRSGWSQNSYAMSNRSVLRYQSKIEMIDYLKFKYAADPSEIWETNLFKNIKAHAGNPIDYFKNQGTHLISGIALGARYTMMTYTEAGGSKKLTKLAAAINAKSDGLFGIGGSKYDLSFYRKKLTESGFDKSHLTFKAEGIISSKGDVDDPAVVSYNGQLLPIYELIEAFDQDGLAAIFKREYLRYKGNFTITSNTKTIATLNPGNSNQTALKLGTTSITEDDVYLLGIAFEDPLDKSYLITFTDESNGLITLSGDNVNAKNIASLLNIDTSTVIRSGPNSPSGLKKLKNIHVSILHDNNSVVTIFSSKNCQYTNNKWYTIPSGNGLTDASVVGMSKKIQSMIVPKNKEVRVYGGIGFTGRLWCNIAGSNHLEGNDSTFALQVFGDNQAKSIKINDQKNPLITLFVNTDYYARTGGKGLFSLPIKDYDSLDDDYLKKNLKGFFSIEELENVKFRLYARVLSMIIPAGVSSSFYKSAGHKKVKAFGVKASNENIAITLDKKHKTYKNAIIEMKLKKE